jgi:hypothetical protein
MNNHICPICKISNLYLGELEMHWKLNHAPRMGANKDIVELIGTDGNYRVVPRKENR